MPTVSWRVSGNGAEHRLDRHLAERLGETRSRAQRWIRDGRVRVDGAVGKPATPLTGGERIEWDPPEPVPADEGPQPEPGSLAVIYQDDDVVVIDKAPGLAVHPGAGRPTGTLVNRLLYHFPELREVGSRVRPGIVHRLDLGTSGVLLVARSQRAYLRLSEAFSRRKIDKRYLALIYGSPLPAEGAIELPIGRHREDRKRMTVRSDGRSAQTLYRIRQAHSAGVALLELDLKTGRTHQIRVHLKSLGHPLVGDPVYGEARWKGLAREVQEPLRHFPRPALHAWRLGFIHPVSGEPVRVAAPLPKDLRDLWQQVTRAPLPQLDDGG